MSATVARTPDLFVFLTAVNRMEAAKRGTRVLFVAKSL